MENPQKENGFTPIANELLEQLVKLRIPASEKDILYFVLRKTYGYQKKEDRISLTQFGKGTLLSRVTVVKALKNLISRNILVKSGLLFKFNKHYNSWVVNAGILVKSENIFGKGGYTKNGKGGYTYKRKKKIQKKEVCLSYLENIPEEDLNDFYSKLDADKHAIKRKGEELYNYCLSKGKQYKNYKAFLRNALFKDFPERKEPIKNKKVVMINGKPTIIE